MPSPNAHVDSDDQVVVAAKVPPHLLERIDAHVSAMRKASPAIHITRSDALRSLILLGLDAVENR